MRRRTILAIGCVAAVLVTLSVIGAGTALAQQQAGVTKGEPDLEVHLPDGEVTPGTEAQLTVQVANRGEVTRGNPADRGSVTTARSVRASPSADDAPFEIKTNRQSLGPVSENEPRELPLRVRVPEDAPPGEYDVDIRLRYSYTESIFPNGNVVNERTRTVTKQVTVTVEDGARFEIEALESDLQVGESGTLRAEVRNVGNEHARDLDVALSPTSSALNFGSDRSTARLSELGPNENATVEYDLSVDSNAVAGGHSLDGEVTFTDPDGIRDTDNRASLSAGVFPEESRDDFLVETETDSITAGETIPVAVEVTNNRNERVTNVEGKLFTNDPLDSNDDEAFVRALEPGESATMTFALEADGNAIEKTYPVSMDFRYDDSDGDSRVSDTYRVAVDVTEGEDGGLPVGVIAAAVGVVLLIGGAYIGYRRKEL